MISRGICLLGRKFNWSVKVKWICEQTDGQMIRLFLCKNGQNPPIQGENICLTRDTLIKFPYTVYRSIKKLELSV